MERGRSVQALARTANNTWQATLDDGATREAPTVFLATGKHDLRGYARPEDPQRWVAFKMYFRLAPAQAAELARASELMLYPGGYGGIQPVEGGIANLCWVVQQRYLARAGNRWENFLAKMQQDCPHLAMRLAGAEPLLAKPIAITHIPYGYIRRTTERWALLHRRSGSRHPLVHRRWHIHRAAYCALCCRCLSCGRAGAALPG